MFAPEFNPIAFSIGPLAVHWYGLMYLLGFAFFWALGRLRAKDPWRQMTANDVEDILFYGVLGVILGGRLGFCFFYQPEWYLSHPLDIFKVWQGGMSAHGGIIGSILAICAFARIKGKTFLDVADFVAPLHGLRSGTFHRGIFPRTRQLSRTGTFRPVQRSMAESPCFLAWTCCLDLGAPTQECRKLICQSRCARKSLRRSVRSSRNNVFRSSDAEAKSIVRVVL